MKKAILRLFGLQGAMCPRVSGLAGITVLCCLLFAFAAPARLLAASAFTTVDVTGAGTAANQGTAVTAIDAAGDVAGIYLDASKIEHAFVRSASGTITTFDASGTGGKSMTSIPIGFDTAGDIVGAYEDASKMGHGFVRLASTGAITVFDAPGAETGSDEGTFPLGINAAGEVVGTYFGTNLTLHGFVCASPCSTGTITTFDAGGVVTANNQGTWAIGINTTGNVVGLFFGTDKVAHGYVRAASSGAITLVDASGAGTGKDQGTFALGIDATGDVTGVYLDANNVLHGFVRNGSSGTITVIDAPGAGTGTYQGTYPDAFDAAGDISGAYTDSNNVGHGFVLPANGTIVTYDAPGVNATASLIAGSGGRASALANRTINASSLNIGHKNSSSFLSKIKSFLGKAGGVTRASSGVTSASSGLFGGDGGGGSSMPYATASLGNLVLNSVNASGQIVGLYTNGDAVIHSYLRAANGTITTFDAPNAGTGAEQGTGGLAINASGTIVGGYIDTNSVIHGFIFAPALTATTTALQSQSSTSIYGGPITLTATVSSAAGAPPNGETVYFKSGATTIGSQTLSGGTAELTTTEAPAGTDSVMAVYPGDLNFSGSTSTAVSQTVSKATTSTTLTSSPNPSTYGQTVTFTATVSGQLGGVATGTMTFSNNGVTLGTAPVNGSAVFTFTALPPTTNTIKAVYSGDSNFYGSTSNTLSQVVNKATPTVTLTPYESSITTAQALSVTVTVSGTPTPTGSVILSGGGFTSTATTLASGSATITIPAGALAIPAGALAIGTDTLTVSYTPDAASSSDYNSASGTTSVTVIPAQAIYTAVKLGVGTAYGINSGGEVVGENGSNHAFLYNGSSMIDLGTLYGSTESVARSINASGQIVGYTGDNIACFGEQYCPEPSPPVTYAFLYSNGVMTAPLSAVPGISASYAYGINDSGMIVGFEYNYSIPGTSPDFPFLDNAGSVVDLGALPGATAGSPGSYAYSWATGINNSGQVAGSSEGVNYSHAFLYTSGSMVDLGTLPGGGGSQAFGINNSGQVVGYSYVSGLSATHAFLYSGGVMTDLGTLPGNTTSVAVGINDAGQIVGAGDTHAFIYSGGAMVDLNYFVSLPTGVYLTNATAINNHGQIAANGSDGNAYLLTTAKLIPNVVVSPSSSSVTTAQPLSVTVAVSGGSGNPTPTGSVTLTSGTYTSAPAKLSSGSATINIPVGALAIGTDTLTVSYTPDAASSSAYYSALWSNSVLVSTGTPPAATPLYYPAAGTYTSAQTVTISDTTPNATIYYAINGTPTTSSAIYNGPITVSSSETIEAIAAASGYTNSAVATAAYTITSGFTLSASPASVTVAQGSSAPISITVTDVGSFSGSVTLSASGLPSGVIASIAPNSPTGTQGLILSAASSTTVTSSPVTVTITGTSGAFSASTTVALTITAQTGSIFDNIVNSCSPYSETGPSCGYYPVFGPTGDFAVPSSDYAAAQFTPSAGGMATDARITVVQTALAPGLGASGLLNVAIFSDASGLPGTQISQTATGVLAPFCCNSAIVTAWFNQSVSLNAGVPYWLVVMPGASDTYVAWSVGGISSVPAAQTLLSGGNCNTWCAYAPSSLQFAIDSGTAPPPGFMLSASPTTLNVPQGSSTTSTITATDEGGFSGAVALTSSGLPSGVTASFAAGSAAGTQVLTLSASSSAAVTTSPATVTIAGTSGSLSAITAVAVKVTAPSSFTLSPSTATLSVVQGSSNTDTITVTGANGFTGAVTLAATGLPSGVTAGFATNPTTGSSVLTLTASSTATVGGPVTVTINGTSGTLTASTTIALTVNPPPNFTLSPSAATLSVGRGSSSTDTITVTPGNGFTGAVTLSAIGLPSGVTAGFATNPTTSSSVLTLTATSSATLGGPVTVTINGISGALTASTTIALTVNKATPSVTAWPTASSITYGQTLASSTLSGGASTPAGSFAFTTPTTAPDTGTASQSVTFTPTDTTDYSTLAGTTSVTVGKASSTTTLTSSVNPSAVGQSVNLTATVTGQYGGTVTGSVTFSNGSTSLGSVSLSGGSAVLATTALPVGTDSVTAVYSGDTNFAGSTSNSVSQVVNGANPVPLTSGITPAFASAGGAAFTLTVTGSGFTTGSTVYWGTSALATTFGSATQLTAQVPAADIATGGIAATISVITPSPGGGTSNSFQFEVDSASGATTGPTFSSVLQTVTAGSPASYSVTLPSTVESATVTCLNLPTGATCSYSATANTVTITTTSASPTGTYQVTVVFLETVSGAATSWILLPILLLPLVFLRRRLAARGVWVTVCLGLVLLAGTAVAAIGCGGGGGGGSTTPPPPQTHQVTSSGTVTLTIQ